MKKSLLHSLGAAALLAAAALAGCSEEQFVASAGDRPDAEALAGIAAELIRVDRVDGTLRLMDLDVEDRLLCRLSRPAERVLTLKVEVDPEAADAYNTEHETHYPLFPSEHVVLFTPTTIDAGARQSEPLRVLFERAHVEVGTYLLPLKATIEPEAVQQQDAAMRFCYVVQVYEDREPGVLDKWPFLTVGYINTEQMNPLYADGFFYIQEVNMGPPMVRTDKTWLDMVPLRKSSITCDAAGRVSFTLGPDLAYVLENRQKYIVPLQRGGRNVLLCINGCLRALSDEQIAEAAYRIAKVVTQNGIDGVNFFDMGDSYDTPQAPQIIPSSYAKLIKATKDALGDKLVTVACDAASTEELSVPHDGIQAGRYIDYAWSGILDKPVDPYAPDAELKPIAGLERSRYGGVLLETHDTGWNNLNGNRVAAEVKDFITHQALSSNIFAFWDMPSNLQGIETGPMSAFQHVTKAYTNPADKYMLAVRNKGWWGNYGTFLKDW